MAAMEKIAILDFSRAEVLIVPISQREDAEDFFNRKGIDSSNVQWMRGDFKILVEDGIKD